MSTPPKNRLSDPDQIIEEFQRRQKRMVVVALSCFVVVVPLAIYVKNINPFFAVGIILSFLIPLFGFYLWTFRCPACGERVQQRSSRLRMPIRCRRCQVLLDPAR